MAGSKKPLSASSQKSKSAPAQPLQSVEYYQVKVADLNEKLQRSLGKCDGLKEENVGLQNALARLLADKQDIVEFLNIKVSETEKLIVSLESKSKSDEKDKKQLENLLASQADTIKQEFAAKVQGLNNEITKARTELDDLAAFALEKESILLDLKNTKALLDKKEMEYREAVHGMERKGLQDKSQIKREMLQKVNEAVANFRKVADQQMAEQLNVRKQIASRIGKRKSNSYQKSIAVLYKKLKESDQILELAFEDLPQQQLDAEGEGSSVQPFNPFAPPAENLTGNMINEIQNLQDDYNQLVDRIGEINKISLDIEFLLNQTKESKNTFPQEDIVEYICEVLSQLIDRLSELTDFNRVLESRQPSAAQSQAQIYTQSQARMDMAFKEADYNDLDHSDEEDFRGMEESKSGEMPILEENSKDMEELQSNSDLHFSQSSEKGEVEILSRISSPQSSSAPRFSNQSSSKSYLAYSSRGSVSGFRTIGLQTKDIPFHSSKVDTEYLLSALRPWGKKVIPLKAATRSVRIAVKK